MKASTPLLSSLAGVLACALLIAHRPAAADQHRTAQLERGRHLVVEVGLCVDCHAPRLANGDYDQTRWLMGAPLPFKPVAEMPWNPVAPQIAGLPTLKDEEAIQFLMTGVRPNGSTPLPPMPAYRLSRQEATDVVSYLRNLAPAQ